MSERKRESVKKVRRTTPSLMAWCVLLSTVGYVSLLSFNVANWYEHGFKAALTTVQRHTETTLSELALRNRWVESYSLAMGQMLHRSLAQYGDEATVTLNHSVAHALGATKFNKKLNQEATQLETESDDVWVLLKLTVWQFSLKVMALFESFWVVACAAIVGGMDGLCKRYIRTSEGGRESTLLYHTAGRRFMLLPLSVIGLYLALPIFISGTMATMALALCFFIYFNVRMSCLKKYL